MMTALPSSAQTARQSAVNQAELGPEGRAVRLAHAPTLETVDRALRTPPGFVEELLRLGDALALPIPLLSQMFHSNQGLPTSDAPQTTEHSDATSGTGAPLVAMQLPVMQLVSLPVNTQRLATEPLTLTAAAQKTGLQTVGMLKPMPAAMLPASNVGVLTVASINPVSASRTSSAPLVGTPAPSEPVTTSVSASGQQARATVANTDMASTLGALSPEAVAVRERSSNHGTGVPTADLANPSPSVSYSEAATSKSTNVQPPGTANRVPQGLVDALGERIEWQLKTGSERAVIRLDPPMQGQLEITIRRDAGAIQVHLSATHGDVVKQLQSVSDTLRQELTGRQTGEVLVVVSHNTGTGRDGDGRGRQPGQTPEQTEPGRALAEAESGQPGTRFALSKSL